MKQCRRAVKILSKQMLISGIGYNMLVSNVVQAVNDSVQILLSLAVSGASLHTVDSLLMMQAFYLQSRSLGPCL